MTWSLLGKGVTVPRGSRPPDAMAGWELCLASLTPGIGLSSDHLTLPLSHLTPSTPQGEGCNRTARAGLEEQDARSDRGKSKQRGS